MQEIYISTDVEADGPIPGQNSMLSFGSAAYLKNKELISTFEVKEPLITPKMSQRDFKGAVARQRLPLMAVVLNKNVNAANVRLRTRPPGPCRFSLLVVVLFRLNPLGLQKHA